MNREQLIMNIKYYSVIGLAKSVACCATVLEWANNQLTTFECWLIGQSTRYRR